MAEWDQSNPNDSSLISQYPQNERDARDAVRANFIVNHHATDDDDVGKHEVIELLANATPTGVAGQGNFYTKDVDSGEIELFYQDEEGNETQITERGVVTLSLFPNVNGEVTSTETELNRVAEHLSVGDLKMWPFSTLKAGHLWADGQTIGGDGSGAAYQGEEYEALFDLLVADAPAWGNAGTEVFADGDTVSLPDMRDRSPLGTASMGASGAGRVDNYSTDLGEYGGEDAHTLTENELPSVSGSFDIVGGNAGQDPVRNESGAFSDGFSGGTSSEESNWSSGAHGLHSVDFDMGGDSSHDNMHPFAAVRFIIAYR